MSTEIAQEFDFDEFLRSDGIAAYAGRYKIIAVIFTGTGSLSTIASICTIVHILRSHHGLSTTYHRLVLGLSFGDVVLSFFGFILGGIMAPKELDYVIPYAMGNEVTCDIQGFLCEFAVKIGLSYSNSMCLYYLAIVTFNKKDDYIRQKLEPLFHGVSILFPIIYTSMMLAINGFNSDGLCRFAPNDRLPHCIGLESGTIREGFTIPCGRGDGKEHPKLYQFLTFVNYGYPLVNPVVIIVTMALMYRSVHKIEKKMQKYGVNDLRNRNKTRRDNNMDKSGSHTCDVNSSRENERILQRFKNKIPCINTCCNSGRSKIKSNTARSQKRAILYRAFGYVVAWILSWAPFLIIALSFNAYNTPVFMIYLHTAFHPLQGVFTFIVYMYPKVKGAKKGHQRRRGAEKGAKNGDGGSNEVSWCRAIANAYMSRGPRRGRGTQQTRYHLSNSESWMKRVSSGLRKLRNSAGALSRMFIKSSNFRNSDGEAAKHLELRPCSNSGERGGVASVRAGIDSKETPPFSIETHSNACSPLFLTGEEVGDLRKEGDVEKNLLNNANDKVSNYLKDDEVSFSEEILSSLK